VYQPADSCQATIIDKYCCLSVVQACVHSLMSIHKRVPKYLSDFCASDWSRKSRYDGLQKMVSCERCCDCSSIGPRLASGGRFSAEQPIDPVISECPSFAHSHTTIETTWDIHTIRSTPKTHASSRAMRQTLTKLIQWQVHNPSEACAPESLLPLITSITDMSIYTEVFSDIT
jgi:hypothetical protein